MKNMKKAWVYVMAVAAVGFTACESDDPVVENDEEVITDVVLKFTELDNAGNPTSTMLEFTASDPQGLENGSGPTIETITLDQNKSYRLQIEVLNSIENEDITEEIEEEDDEHQFFFLGSAFVGSAAPMTYVYNDDQLGLDGRLTVSTSSFNTANMRVILRHDLDKSFPGTDNPSFENFAAAGGSSDLDITFQVVLN
ncbi:hypothetical protein [Algoriphagus namhaensis]